MLSMSLVQCSPQPWVPYLGCAHQMERGESSERSWGWSPIICDTTLQHSSYPVSSSIIGCIRKSHSWAHAMDTVIKSSPFFSNNKHIASVCFGHLQLYKEIKGQKFLSRKCCSRIPPIQLTLSPYLGWFGKSSRLIHPALKKAEVKQGQTHVCVCNVCTYDFTYLSPSRSPIYKYLSTMCLSL